MPNYRRAWTQGGTFFFTLTLENRAESTLLTDHIDVLREVVRKVRANHPFHIHAWAVLPDHLHCVIELPDGEADFANLWRLIKGGFSKKVPRTEELSPSRERRNERGIWQRRYWEHCIRDEADFLAHMDYVHINPLKHGLVERVRDWPYTTFHGLVERGVYPIDWGGEGFGLSLSYDD